jgi:hypothetical protein
LEPIGRTVENSSKEFERSVLLARVTSANVRLCPFATRGETMQKKPYEAPVLQKLGLLRLLTHQYGIILE